MCSTIRQMQKLRLEEGKCLTQDVTFTKLNPDPRLTQISFYSPSCLSIRQPCLERLLWAKSLAKGWDTLENKYTP